MSKTVWEIFDSTNGASFGFGWTLADAIEDTVANAMIEVDGKSVGVDKAWVHKALHAGRLDWRSFEVGDDDDDVIEIPDLLD